MEKKILVTEANEITATEVLNQLLSLEIPVRIAVGDPAKLADIQGVEIMKADYHDPDALPEIFRDIRGVFMVTPFAPDLADMVRNLSAAARTFAVEHIVYQSEMGAENPNTVITQWHLKAEQYIKASGIAFTFLRPNFIMQDFMTRQGENILKSGKISVPLGDSRVSYVDARDVAACAVECLTRDQYHGMGYTLTGPEALSIHDIAGILSDVLGRKVEYESLSGDEARRRMAHAGLPGWLIDAHLDRHERYRVGNAGAEISTGVRDITGREPRNFRDFANEYAERWLASIEA